MAGQATPRAILLDCLGTLVRLEPPAPRLRASLRRRFGIDVGDEAADRAIRAEIEFYRAHLHEGTDEAAVIDLHWRCAEVLREQLPEVAFASVTAIEAALLESLVFNPYGDAVPALEDLRTLGIRLVVVSNWDASLHDVLRRTGLDLLLDGAISSAEVGAAKPDPAPIEVALDLAGVSAHEAWLVGDTPAADVDGAVAAGVTPILIDRQPRVTGSGPSSGSDPSVRRIRSLLELPG